MNFEKIQKNIEKSSELKELYRQTTVYINAGGRGTRLEPIIPKKGSKGIAKALLQFDNDILIVKHLKLLTKFGFRNIIVGAGDHQEITRFLEGKFDNVVVNDTEVQEDTGGDLIKAIKNCKNCGKNILVENVDTLLVIKDVDELLQQHQKNNTTATIVLTTRKGVPNEGAFYVDQNGKVVYSKEGRNNLNIKQPKNWKGFRGSSTGLVIFQTNFLKNHPWQPGDQKLSVYKDLIPELIERGELYAYNNEDNLFIDIGTPKSYNQVKRRERRIFNAIGNRYLKNN